MRRMLSLSVASALVLLLLGPVRPAAAANVVFRGKVTSTFFYTLTYTTDSKISHNQAQDDKYTSDYKNSLLVLADNNQGALGTLDASNNVTLIAPPLISVAADQNNTSFILDGTTKDTQMFVSFHAYLATSSADPKKASAFGHVVELAADGTVNSTDIFLELQVQ